MTRKAKAVWIGFLAPVPVITLWVWTFVSSAVSGQTHPALEGSSIIAGILVLVLPWCYWPKRGTRRRAVLKAYRVGFAYLGAPCVAVIAWMALRLRFVVEDDGSGASGIVELFVAMLALIGIGIAVVIAWIAAIVRAVRWKHPLECERCGYSLVGLGSGKCPECGKKTP